MMEINNLYFEKQFKIIEEKYNLNFEDKNLLVKAFTHSSYNSSVNKNYQRLEFLGDSILQLVMSDYLYRNYPQDSEGVMSKRRAVLVSKSSLAYIIRDEGLEKFIIMGKSIIMDNEELSDSYVSDIFESFVATIYLDNGYEKASQFIHQTLISRIDILQSFDSVQDYKSKLQEDLQINGSVKLEYQTVPCDNQFKSMVFLQDCKIGEGIGSTKKKAEHQAAKHALETKVSI